MAHHRRGQKDLRPKTPPATASQQNRDPISPGLLDKEPAVRAVRAVGELASPNRTLDLFSCYDPRFDRHYHRAYNNLMAKRKHDFAERTQQFYP